MKNIINHDVYGQIIFDESFWTGKKDIYINGVKLAKVDRKTYSYRAQIEKKDEFGDNILNEYGQRTYESINKTVYFKGNFISGASIEIDNVEIEVSKKAQWYELVLMWLPFVFVLIWGNMDISLEIFPVVGGLIGGLITLALGVWNIGLMKAQKNIGLKLAIGIGIALPSIFICNLIGLALVSGL